MPDTPSAYSAAMDGLEAAARFHDLLLRTTLPAKRRELEGLVRAGRRLWRSRSNLAIIWPVAEAAEQLAEEPAVRVCGTAYTCALEAAWQVVEWMRRHVFLLNERRRARPAARFLCALILDGPDSALGADPTAEQPRFDPALVRADWPPMAATFRDEFGQFDAQELTTLLRLEANRVNAEKTNRRDESANSARTEATHSLGLAPLMTHGQRRLWDALAGRCLSAKDLCADNELDTSEDTVRQWVHQLRRSGRDIRHRRGCGYYRPDSPPPDEPT